ncbi:FMN-dependent oxidoreductase, nitrilotriacetate monooxygenase family [Pseudonocardia dioxanivorans CB1190]|jgi:FMN-dependent oxidoreductase (nitrilotriacetate monooxygenase family)|uniref:FMN-dependent oxidoreductase, nitrilotriacetate monooxygenase family n=1 Tax=Pseudonocardia dioxanivorans (strain ATCC 55486 / DSM 44775 / JCM 13855 / CB1190) TaxID=675635 RepID=F4CQ87_PSEUX|nr:LLM class flavin-dependent oxidoreductase [Pseudonocardia dioxanivorans]AEA28360.1 FMN-dependent oxidoreductase, nitrilotriacetate monooxygenase family [Pseudonocardia dioxanivorans CB1190]
MTSNRRIMLNGFKSATIGHTALGLWTHPDNAVRDYGRLDYWTGIARTLERGCFDALFIADAQGVIDVYQGSTDVTLREALGIPIIDPMLLVSAMAAATEHLGFAVTASTTYEKPFDLARKFATLDLVTGGRVGWNIVTSSSRSEAENFGMSKPIPHDERYRIADEFMDVVYKLWESSWDDDAVVHDRERRVFVDPAKVRRIEHHGKYFDVPGIFICEPSPQRTPALYQAGSSTAGIAFAARHAEGVFVSFPRMDMVRDAVRTLRAAAVEAGRPPGDLKVFPLSTVVTAETDELAWEKYHEYRAHSRSEANLARFSALVHVDMAALDPDEPLEYVESDGIQGSLSVFTKADPTRKWTPREIGEFLSVSSMGALFVGSPTTVADQLEEWVEQADVDGFNISDTLSSVTFPDFVDLVVPELRRRGRVWSSYEGATFREHLYGPGHARTMPGHPATEYRRG